MTAQHDPGRRLAEHLRREAPDRAPTWVLESALEIIETTPQRRVLPRLPWRFPAMNPFAKYALYAITALVVLAGALALATGGYGLQVGGPVTASPSPSPSPTLSPSPTPGQSPTATTIGSLTMTTTGCQWVGNTTALPAGPIQVDVTNNTPDSGAFPLFVVDQGHTFAELATILQGYDTQAHQNPNTIIQVNPDMATGAGIIGLLASGKTSTLSANVPAGSVVGIACVHADPTAGVTYDVFSVGPLQFK